MVCHSRVPTIPLPHLFALSSRYSCTTDNVRCRSSWLLRPNSTAIQRIYIPTLQQNLWSGAIASGQYKKSLACLTIAHNHTSVTFSSNLKRSCTSTFQLLWEFFFQLSRNFPLKRLFIHPRSPGLPRPQPKRSQAVPWSCSLAPDLLSSCSHEFPSWHAPPLPCNEDPDTLIPFSGRTPKPLTVQLISHPAPQKNKASGHLMYMRICLKRSLPFTFLRSRVDHPAYFGYSKLPWLCSFALPRFRVPKVSTFFFPRCPPTRPCITRFCTCKAFANQQCVQLRCRQSLHGVQTTGSL